ncbi:MAG: MBL fold metallo-hydrolase [Armatimonadetes bacterium]|nr:MBL fold metallo-hydrolase [Armatimonadota bacterium]
MFDYRKIVRWTCGCVLAGGYLFAQFPKSVPDRLVFLRVGQGDCTLIQYHGRSMLVDCGPANDQTNGAERLVVPELYRLGVRQLDWIFMTHPDADHVGGLGVLYARFQVDKIGIPKCFQSNPDMQQALLDAEVPTERVEWLGERAWIQKDELKIELRTLNESPTGEDNDGSLFARVQMGGSTAVMSGDASAYVEEMVQSRAHWTAQVVKLGHHGSRTSTSPQWLDSLHPEVAIISVGRNNSYGHPAKGVVESCLERRIQVMRTDQDGTLEFHPGPNGFQLLNKRIRS